MITVSIPVHATPSRMVGRALKSVLANDAVSLVVVTLDGPQQYKPPAVGDSRVVVWSTSRNRGRYYIDDVVSRAAPTERFTVHDADDWSDPGRLDAMAEVDADIVYTDRETHALDGTVILRRAKTKPPASLDVMWGHMALYKSDWVRGLYHPGFRVSWDAVLDNIAYRYGQHAKVEGPLYRIEKRAGSLTTDPSSALRSEYRRAVATIHRHMWHRMKMRCTDVNCVAEFIAESTAPALAADRDRDVAALSALIRRGRTRRPGPNVAV